MMPKFEDMTRKQLEAEKKNLLCEISELKRKIDQRDKALKEAEETEALREEVSELAHVWSKLVAELDDGIDDPEITDECLEESNPSVFSFAILLTPERAEKELNIPLSNNSRVLFLVSDDMSLTPEEACREALSGSFTNFIDSRLHENMPFFLQLLSEEIEQRKAGEQDEF